MSDIGRKFLISVLGFLGLSMGITLQIFQLVGIKPLFKILLHHSRCSILKILKNGRGYAAYSRSRVLFVDV